MKLMKKFMMTTMKTNKRYVLPNFSKKDDLEKIKIVLKNLKDPRLRFSKKIKIKDIQDIVDNFFLDKTGTYNTNSNYGYNSSTYYMNNSLQCDGSGRSRSFYDFYRICLYYFKNISLEKCKEIFDSFSSYLNIFYCCTTCKIVSNNSQPIKVNEKYNLKISNYYEKKINV